MAGKVKPIPDGFHTITPYLTVPGVAKLIDFLKQAFDAKEIERMQRPDGTVQHAEVKIGDSIVIWASRRVSGLRGPARSTCTSMTWIQPIAALSTPALAH